MSPVALTDNDGDVAVFLRHSGQSSTADWLLTPAGLANTGELR